MRLLAARTGGEANVTCHIFNRTLVLVIIMCFGVDIVCRSGLYIWMRRKERVEVSQESPDGDGIGTFR
jgi:hypothetical protein